MSNTGKGIHQPRERINPYLIDRGNRDARHNEDGVQHKVYPVHRRHQHSRFLLGYDHYEVDWVHHHEDYSDITVED